MAEYLLVVEDDEEVRENLAVLLGLRGYRVRTAREGREALARIEQHGQPCLIILDLMMPVMDGWTFHAAVKADSALRQVPVIILSGVTDASSATRALEAVGHLKKPCDLNKLYGLVAAHC